jgi:hypothetical protein
MNIIIKFPCRGRPAKFKSTFTKYYELLSKKHDIKFVFTFDNDDITMNNEDIRSFLAPYKEICEINYGNSKTKIEAVNANLEDKKFDILLLASDDMIPILHGFDNIICTDIQENFSDLDGSVQYYNPMWEDKLDVVCIMGYAYYKRFNYIYFPEYKSIFCDNEFTQVKNALKKNKYFSGKQMFIHDFITNDETAAKNWHFNNDDERLFNQRLLINFNVQSLCSQ